MEAQRTRPSFGRWYILFLISLMYLITYLDRVNISTAAPVISNEFGFDKITMGIIFSAFVWAYALFQVPGGWLNDRFGPRRVLAIIVAYWSVMTGATAAATGAVSFVFVRFLFGIGEGGAFPGATRAMQLWYPRHERGFCQGITHSASLSRSGDRASPGGLDHYHAWLAMGLLHLRCSRHRLVGVVVPGLPQLAGGARARKQSGARTHPRHRRSGECQCAENRDEDQRAVGHPAAISQHVGDHVRLLYLCLLPLDLFELVAVLSGGVSAVYAAQGRAVGFAAALGRRRRRHGRRPSNRLALEKDRQYQVCPAGSGHHRHVGLRGVHCAGWVDRRPINCRILLDRCHVFSRMHHRAVLGSPHGCRRQIFRDRVRDDEHGGKHRRRALPVSLRGFCPVRARGGGAA